MNTAILTRGIGKRYRLHAASHRPAALDRRIRRSRKVSDAIQAGVQALGRRLTGQENPEALQDLWALQDINLEIPEGAAVGLIGANGSGKSTLLKILARVTEPTRGSARLRGRVASLLEIGTGFHRDLNARQNIYLNGAILGMKRREINARFDRIVEFAGIEAFLEEPVKHLSSGMYMRLAFAVAAYLESEILLVDEVMAVGDAQFQHKCLGTMRDAAEGGRTVIFVSHNMGDVSSLTRRSIVLEQGRIDFDGPTTEAIDHYMRRSVGGPLAGRVKTSELVCKRHDRLGEGLVIDELGFAPGQSQEIPVSGTLRMEFVVAARSRYAGVHLAYTVLSLAGQPLLTGLSPEFKVGPGRQRVELDIAGIDLVPGDYELGINLGTGGLGSTKVEHDNYMGFGRITVTPGRSGEVQVGPWWNRWSRVIHRDSTIRLSDPPDTNG